MFATKAVRLFKKWLHVGVQSTFGQLRRHQIVLLNYAIAAVVAFICLLFMTNIWAGTYWAAGIDLLVIALLGVPYRLNAKGKTTAATITFILLLLSCIIAVAGVAYSKARFTDTEYLIVPLVAFCALLLDGKKLNVLTLLTIITFLVLKTVRIYLQIGFFEPNAVLALFNNFVVIGTVYVGITSFKVLIYRLTREQAQQRQTLYTLIDSLPIFVALLDANRKYSMVNKSYETTFGMARSQIIGKTPYDVLPANITDKHLPLINQAFYGHPTEFADYTNLPDGTSIFAQGIYMPIFNKEGEVRAVATFVNDLTQLKDAENKIVDQNEELKALTHQLKEANQTKDRLFSVISHDLRGPLSSLMGVLELTQQGQIGQQEFQQLIGGLVKNVTNNIQLLNNLLYWSKSQMDGIKVKPKAFLMNELIEQNTDLFAHQAEDKGLTIEKVMPEQYLVHADPDMVDLVVRNLVSNAIKFSCRHGHIKVYTKAATNRLCIGVADDGIGMSQEQIKGLFNITSGSRRGTSNEKGTGLGLRLCKDFLERNGSMLQVSSQLGLGSIFEFELPLVTNED